MVFFSQVQRLEMDQLNPDGSLNMVQTDSIYMVEPNGDRNSDLAIFHQENQKCYTLA